MVFKTELVKSIRNMPGVSYTEENTNDSIYVDFNYDASVYDVWKVINYINDVVHKPHIEIKELTNKQNIYASTIGLVVS